MLPAAVALLTAAAAAAPEIIVLRPDLPRSQEEFIGPNDTERRIRKVTSPTLQPFPPNKPNGAAIVVVPGGGFRHLAIDKEGTGFAQWLNTLGITAFVLQYRVTLDDPAAGRAAAVEDGLLAMKTVRARAAEWKLDPARIGIAGFSAGGYVAAAAAMSTDPATRPAFAIPIYPAAPNELTVPAGAPPLFLAMAHDDRLTLDHGVRIYSAWNKAGASAELHIFPRGGHGFGIRKTGAPTDTWTDRLAEWLKTAGVLGTK